MKLENLIIIALFFSLAEFAIGDDRSLVEAQISEQMKVFQAIATSNFHGATIKIVRTSLVIERGMSAYIENVTVGDTIPTPDGFQLIYGVGAGPYGGPRFYPPWPEILDLHSGGRSYGTATALISDPEEELYVIVTVKYGREVPPEKLRSLHQEIFREAGSFQRGSTFFKALSVARINPIEGSPIFEVLPGATYDTGYVLRRNGGQINYGKLPDISTDSSTATPSGRASTTPVLEKESPATVKKEPATTRK